MSENFDKSIDTPFTKEEFEDVFKNFIKQSESVITAKRRIRPDGSIEFESTERSQIKDES